MTGVLPVDKPAGPTSHDVVAAARRALHTRRVGHTGTLDPFATGLLMLCIGPATRLAEYLTGMDKQYEATALLGVRTDTLDRTGAVESETDAWKELDTASIRAAFEEQTGTLAQKPPAFSAKRVRGKRSYELARQGQAVELEPVEVTIHSLDVLAVEGPEVRFAMRCSSGTYVRAVARDAGTRLGVGAHLTTLRRTGVGAFDVKDAVLLDDLSDPAAVETALLTPLEALAHMPRLELDPDQVRRVGHGQGIAVEEAPTGLVALAAGSELQAVGESDGKWVRPRKVFS